MGDEENVSLPLRNHRFVAVCTGTGGLRLRPLEESPMRLKIIAGNLVVVLLLGIISFFVVRGQLHSGLVSGLGESLQKDAILLERSWQLSGRDFLALVEVQAGREEVRDVFVGLDSQQRRQRAHQRCNEITRWFADPARGRRGPPDIVVVTDETGATMARNLDPNRTLPLRQLSTLRQVLQDGTPRLDTWLYEQEGRPLQMGIARIESDEGATFGALVVGYEVSDGLARAEADLLQREVAFVTEDDARSSLGEASPALQEALFAAEQQEATRAALQAGASQTMFRADLDGDHYIGVLAHLPDSHSLPVAYAVLANETEQASLASVANILLVTTLMGVLFVVVYGWIIGNGFLKPLESIEEGVLAVINGRTDLRIDVESAEFGGLSYRINQLINVFTGVEEEDEEGRVSTAPAPPQHWRAEAVPAAPASPSPGASAGGAAGDALDDPEVAAELAALSEQEYLDKLFEDYVAAKTAIGENVSNIPKERFFERLRKNASALTQKHGCRDVRFRVETAANQVKLRPVLIR